MPKCIGVIVLASMYMVTGQGRKVAETYVKGFKLTYYDYDIDKTTFIGAVVSCNSRKENLVYVTNLEINNAIGKLFKGSGVDPRGWIGASSLFKNQWSWLNGIPLSTGYTNWDDGEPNDMGGQEHCAEMIHRLTWNDLPCNTYRGYICQLDLGRSKTIRNRTIVLSNAPNKAKVVTSLDSKGERRFEGWMVASLTCITVIIGALVIVLKIVRKRAENQKKVEVATCSFKNLQVYSIEGPEEKSNEN